MNKDPDGDRVIKDGSGSCVCFVRDMDYIKKKLNVPIKNSVQLFSVILVITVLTSIISVLDDLTLFIVVAEFSSIILFAAAVIAAIYFRNRFVLSSICTMFTVYNDRLDIDGTVFEISNIRSAFMTPFEYYGKRFICFEYNNKKYRFYFGKFNGIGRSELLYKPYVQLNMLLESRGFSNKY